MSRGQRRFSSRRLNLYVPLEDLRDVRQVVVDGRRVKRWSSSSVMQLFTSRRSSLWLSSELARHANVIVMVNQQQFHPALNKKRFDAMVKWLLRWQQRGMLADTPLHLMFYTIEKHYSVRFGCYSAPKTVCKACCQVLPNGRLYFQARIPKALSKDALESEKVIVSRDVVIHGDFWQLNTLRLTPPASSAAPRDPYFESSFRSLQKRVERQAGLDRHDEAKPAAVLPAIVPAQGIALTGPRLRASSLTATPLPAIMEVADRSRSGRPPLPP